MGHPEQQKLQARMTNIVGAIFTILWGDIVAPIISPYGGDA
jgi:hypothetical protein